MSETVEKKGLLPKLRFPEFQGTPFAADDAGTFFKAVSDRDHNKDLPVLAITQDHGAIPRDLIDYNVSVTDASLAMYKVVRDGDFIISLRSFQGGIERSSYTGLCSPAYIILRADEGVQAEFFRHYFKTKEYISQLNRELEGLRDGKMISYSQFARIPLPMPSIAEQRKIAECLQSLDELIGAEMEKLEALKRHKKGLLQQLFPAEGETIPRLRFPQFRGTGSWQENTVREACARIMDGTHFSPKSTSGPFMYLTSKNIQNGELQLESVCRISHEEHDAIYKRCPVEVDDVLLTKDGANTGNCALNTIDEMFSLLSSVAVLRGREGVLKQHFLYHSLMSDNMQAKLRGAMAGQAITRITLEVLGAFPLHIPSLEEQERVARFLDATDSAERAAAAALRLLRTHKAALMQQLFPSIDELDGITQ